MSNNNVKTVAGVALALVFLFATVGFLRSEPDLEEEGGFEPAHQSVAQWKDPAIDKRTTENDNTDIHPDFAKKFATENAARVSQWKRGIDVSDPLAGYEAMSRANRRGGDKFDPIRDRSQHTAQMREHQLKMDQVDNFLQENNPSSNAAPQLPLSNAYSIPQKPLSVSNSVPQLPPQLPLTNTNSRVPPTAFSNSNNPQIQNPGEKDLQFNDFEDRLSQLRKQAEENRRLDDAHKREIESIYQKEGAPSMASPVANLPKPQDSSTHPSFVGIPDRLSDPKNVNQMTQMNRNSFISPASQVSPEIASLNGLMTSMPGLVQKPEFWGEQVHPTCYLPQGRNTCAPEFVIAGAMKCGTTSLFEYLLAHPKVLPLRKEAKLNGKTVLALKEVRFFNDPLYQQMVTRSGIDKALSEYYNLFPFISPNEGGENYGKISGEASPMYICSKYAGMRARGALPFGKIILQLRDPVDRAYSEIWFRQSLQRSLPVVSNPSAQASSSSPRGANFDDAYEDAFVQCMEYEMAIFERCRHREIFLRNPSVETSYELMDCIARELANTRSITGEACDLEENRGLCVEPALKRYCVQSNLKNSYYFHQIIEWVENFPSDQLMIIRSEDFYGNTVNVMQRVAEFLHIDDIPFDWSQVTEKAFNIINPGTRSGEGQVTVDSTVPGLKVGAADHDKVGSYPKLNPSVRRRLQEWFEEHNQAMSDYLGTHLMWKVGDQPHH